MEWNLEVPSVVEALTFWLMSSMGGPGTWKMPQVGTEDIYLNPERPCTVYDVMAYNPVAAKALSLL